MKALSLNKHKVIRASRNSDVKVNVDDPASIRAVFEKVRSFDAVISCAGNAAFKPFAELTDPRGARSLERHVTPIEQLTFDEGRS